MHNYGVVLIHDGGRREVILEPQPSINLARNVARRVKARLGRRVVLTRDGRELQGGANGLDDEAYALWSEQCE